MDKCISEQGGHTTRMQMDGPRGETQMVMTHDHVVMSMGMGMVMVRVVFVIIAHGL